MSFLHKFGPKVQNCLFKVKFSTETNLNMPNSMVMFTFSFLTRNTIFGPEIQNRQFKLKFGT